MGRSLLVICLALLTMFLVLGWAWYTRREALSGPHYFGERDDEKTGPDTGKPSLNKPPVKTGQPENQPENQPVVTSKSTDAGRPVEASDAGGTPNKK